MNYYYMAYGSNLNLKRMGWRCPDSVLFSRGYLRDYCLAFRGNDVGHLTIDKEKNGVVPFGIFKVSERDIERLDMYEGYPLYYDRWIMNDGDREIFVYVMNVGFDYCLPTVEYLTICKEGYNDMRFSKVFLARALKRSIDRKYGIR